MASAKQALVERLAKCHLVLEVRDARVSTRAPHTATSQRWVRSMPDPAMRDLDLIFCFDGSCFCVLCIQIPFSSGNPEFENLLQHKKKIVVLNKSDLADPRSFGDVRRWFEARGQPVMLMAGDPIRPRVNKRTLNGPASAAAQTGVNRAQMRALHQLIADTLGPRKFASVPPVVLVVGLPNTGKSTLINNFRLFGKLGLAANANKRADESDKEDTAKMQKGGVAKVGAQPGVTRAISGFLVATSMPSTAAKSSASNTGLSIGGSAAAQSDKLFLLDTPGIMLPYIGSDRRGVELGLKLGAIAALSDVAVGEEVLCRYALYALNRSAEFAYVRELQLSGPTTDVGEVLMAVWRLHFQQTVSNSALFKDFARLAEQRRRSDEEESRDRERLQRLEEDADEEQQAEEGEVDGERRSARVVDADAPSGGRALPHAVAPLPSYALDPDAASPAAVASAPSHTAQSSSSSSSTVASSSSSSSPQPTSIAELSTEESLLCTGWFLKRFRRGELGKLMLDEVPRSAAPRSATARQDKQH